MIEEDIFLIKSTYFFDDNRAKIDLKCCLIEIQFSLLKLDSYLISNYVNDVQF